jgi:uncharacterized protein (DUF58 family)
MRPTGRGAGTALAAVALLGTGFAFGYPELAVLGSTAVVALACAVAYASIRPRLDVTRSVEPDRVGRGDSCTQTLTVHNGSRLRAATLVAEDRCGPANVPVPLLRLRPAHDTTVEYPVPTGKRGVVRLGPLTVTRRDPLGLISAGEDHGGTAQVWVHPRVHPIQAVPVGVMRSLDGRIDRVPYGSITFDRLREYLLGDDLRRVHWRTSARVGELMVREQLDTSLPRIVVLLDDRAGAHHDDSFEDCCEAAASILVAAVREDLAVELVQVSDGATTSATTGASADVRPLLDRLAEADPRPEPTPDTTPDPATDALTAVTRRLRQHRIGDTLVYLTGTPQPDGLASIGALTPAYPTVIAAVFVADTTAGENLSTVDGLRILAVTDAVDFAAAWDGVDRW